MNILHYVLGLPTERHGGSTKYAFDLMYQQQKEGNTVTALCPGDTLTAWGHSNIKYRKSYERMKIYSIKNPVLSPLLFGVRKPSSILKRKTFSFSSFESFYSRVRPNILHIHTFMGLPIEILEFFRSKGVKVVFTSHDYYGICLKVNLITNNGDNCMLPCAERCAVCNTNAPSSLFLKVCNSTLYMYVKRFLSFKSKSLKIIKSLREEPFSSRDRIMGYAELLGYYKKMYSLIDSFHFNSNLSKEVYLKYIPVNRYSVIPITVAGVTDNRVRKYFDEHCVKIAFIGSLKEYKGFPYLRECLMQLYSEKVLNWELQVWANGYIGIDEECNKIHYKGGYKYSDLKNVFENIDLLVVPSVWNETFSLITLEALSYGVPVLVSATVGAKDIISRYDESFVLGSHRELKGKLKSILSEISVLERYNGKIIESEWQYSEETHSRDMMNYYKTVI